VIGLNKSAIMNNYWRVYIITRNISKYENFVTIIFTFYFECVAKKDIFFCI
jgi:hypothetical protein